MPMAKERVGWSFLDGTTSRNASCGRVSAGHQYSIVNALGICFHPELLRFPQQSRLVAL
jgi:hypothetical protein